MVVEIITPEKEIFKGEVTSVKLPGKMAPFEVLDNHVNIISSLEKGIIELSIKDIKNIHSDFQNKVIDKKLLSIDVKGGFIEVKNNKILILID